MLQLNTKYGFKWAKMHKKGFHLPKAIRRNKKKARVAVRTF